jgi:tetratricopeptide (TPR) repeat protein
MERDKEMPCLLKLIPMKIIRLILFLTFYLPQLKAQSIDSVAQLILKYNYQAALAIIDRIPADSMDLESMYLKATALKALSKFPEAIQYYNHIFITDSTNVQIAIELADCHKSVMNHKKALELYDHALQTDPDNRYLMHLLATICMTMEQYGRAKSYYLKACINDTSVFLLKQIGLCYEKEVVDDSAIYYYRRAMIWNSDDYQPVFRLGNLYKDQRKYGLGIAVTDSFLLKHPENRDINRLSGYLQYLNQSFTKAIERFNQCLSIGDSSLFVHKYLGYSYFRNADHPNAIKYLEKVYAVDSMEAELCYALALSHDPPENLRYFNSAINLASPIVTVLAQVYGDLSLALTKNWQYDEALQALLKARELLPGDVALTYKIGIHYDNWMDDKPMALRYYKEFLSTRTDTASSYIITGTSVINQEDYTHAENRIRDIEIVMGPGQP